MELYEWLVSMTSLQTVRNFLQKTGASQEIFHSIAKMERIGTALKIERQSQSRITDFFFKIILFLVHLQKIYTI